MEQKYYIWIGDVKRFSSFYPNWNWRVSDIIVWRTNSYFSFNSEKEAIEFLENCIEQVKEYTHYIEWLKPRLIKRLEKMKKDIYQCN